MKKYQLIPEPKQIDINNEKFYNISCKISSDSEDFAGAITTFIRCAKKIHKADFEIGNGGIEIIKDLALCETTYIIEANEKIIVRASTSKAAAYAMATILQLMQTSKTGVFVPECTITDYPDKDYRTLMIDLSKQWHPFRTLISYVDMCFFFKVSYLHLHYMDNDRYTFPSKLYPNLPEQEESYSFEEIEYLSKYACEAGVEIIPEVECPGHAIKIIERLPEIFANDLESEPEEFINELGESMGADQSIVCAGSESTYVALSNIIDEICEMFPHSKYIHIGGDEAQLSIWNNCRKCKQYMREKGIKTVGGLYSHFVARITDMVLEKGRIPIVWEGFPEEGCDEISRDVVVVAWENYYFLADRLLDAGFKVINGSWQPLYIVNSIKERWDAYDILHWNVYNWQHWWEHSCATLNPINVSPTENVLGGQISCWGCTYEQEFIHVLENVSALSERTWNVQRRCTDEDFNMSIKKLTPYAVKVCSHY